MHLFADLITAVAFLSLFAGAEVGRRRGVVTSVTRQAVHALGAMVAALFPLYLALGDVVLLGILFSSVLLWTWSRGRLRSVHAVTRSTLGALVFPLGVVLTALTTWPHPGAFSFAMLVLALADPLAGAVGAHSTGPRWRVPGGRKSIAGSAAFFTLTLVLALIFAATSHGPLLFSAVTVAAILSALEGTVGYGLDNVTVPVLAGVLGKWMLGI